jgi:hypothetical protein
MPFVPGFLPSQNAPLFGNGPWPSGTALTISVPGLPAASIDATRMGLCGGMSFLARDIFESGTPQLRGWDSARIPVPVALHVLHRLVQSFGGAPVVLRWISATRALDHDTVFWGRGLFGQTVAECPAVMADIDAGVLCPIGIVLAQSWGPWEVFQNHVVLVWGYELLGTALTLHTYDCNFPRRDDIVIQLDISAPAPAKQITTNGTAGPGPNMIRGFFRLPYSHADPEPAYVDDAAVSIAVAPPAQLAADSTAPVLVTATNRGSTSWAPELGYRLGSQAPRDNTTWGTGRVELPGPVDPQGTVSFAFDVTAPAAAGGYPFCWQMVREGVRWFGAPTAAVPIGVGSSTPLCDQLHQQHDELKRQLDEVNAEIAAIDWSDPITARHEAAALARRASDLQRQLSTLEAQQVSNSCVPG